MADTLAGAVEFEQDVRRSRFLARAAPAESVADALAFIERVREADATHNVFAWRIGEEYRFSDDGEPSGTAGRPVLQAIDGQGFDRVVVVVARWFGGTKLGAGGLVRAYGGSAAECLRSAPRQALIETVRATVHCDFASAAALHGRLAEFGARKLDERFIGADVEIDLELPRAALVALSRFVGDRTRGRGRVSELDAG